MDFCSLVLGHCRLGVIPVEAGRRKTWKIPACNFLRLGLHRDGGGWSITPLQKASQSIGEPPTAHIMLLGVYTEPVNTVASEDYMATQMSLAEIKKREGELYRECLPHLLLVSMEVPGHLEIWQHPQVKGNTSHSISKSYPVALPSPYRNSSAMTALNSLERLLQIKVYTKLREGSIYILFK